MPEPLGESDTGVQSRPRCPMRPSPDAGRPSPTLIRVPSATIPHVVRPQQALPLGGGETAQRLAGRDDPGLDDLPPVPLPDVVGGMADGAFLDAPVEVEQLVDVDRDALAEALAGRAHAVGMIEREAVRPADERPAAAQEEHPQVGVDLGDRADGAAAAGAEALLVDHDAGSSNAALTRRMPVRSGRNGLSVSGKSLPEPAGRISVRTPAISIESRVTYAPVGPSPKSRGLHVHAALQLRPVGHDQPRS